MPTKPSTAPKRTTGASEQCIVVGYDGSPEARHAAVWAARRAAPKGKLVIVHASRPRRRWLPVAILQTGDERSDRGHALLDELLMDADDALLDIALEADVVDETPARALIHAARQHDASEIVVGSHHPSRAEAIYGDVTAELVQSAPVPVCVVPLEETPEPPPETV